MRPPFPPPPVGAHDADAALAISVAKAQLGRREELVDDVVVAADTVIHQLRAAGGADDEERWHLALADAGREFDVDLLPVVESPQRPPGRIVALDLVTEIDRGEIDAGRDRRRGFGGRVLLAERDELVFGILPRDRGHVGRLGRAQLEQIGAAIGVDDEVGHEIRPRRLHQDVDALGGPCPALRIADDPAHRVAGGDRAGAHELLALLQLDVGDLARRRVGLIERARRIGIDLNGVDEAIPIWLHARGGVGAFDAHFRVRRLWRLFPARQRLQLAWQGQWRRLLDDLDRQRRIGGELRGYGAVVIDVGRNKAVGAAAERGDGQQQSRQSGFTEKRIPAFPVLLNYGKARSRTAGFHENRRGHSPRSFDQLMAVT